MRDKGLLLREACSQDPAHGLALGSGFSGHTEERREVTLVANTDVISCSDFSFSLHSYVIHFRHTFLFLSLTYFNACESKCKLMGGHGTT